MSIDSCDHGDYIVVYEIGNRNECPVCVDGVEQTTEIQELKAEVELLKDAVQ